MKSINLLHVGNNCRKLLLTVLSPGCDALKSGKYSPLFPISPFSPCLGWKNKPTNQTTKQQLVSIELLGVGETESISYADLYLEQACLPSDYPADGGSI
jgi:hypothetical protein